MLRTVVFNYERNENIPSIEVVLKLIDAFNVTVDFLLGKGEYVFYNKETVERLNNIEKMDDKLKVFCLMLLIPTYKTLKPNKRLHNKIKTP